MCEFIFEVEPYWNGDEYVAIVQMGNNEWEYITFDVLLEERTVEITYPPEVKLHQMETSECIEELKEWLWNNIKLRQFFK